MAQKKRRENPSSSPYSISGRSDADREAARLEPAGAIDLVGLDVRLGIADYLAGAIGPSFTAPQVLRDKVAAGKLGKKSGEGFYLWSADGKRQA